MGGWSRHGLRLVRGQGAGRLRLAGAGAAAALAVSLLTGAAAPAPARLAPPVPGTPAAHGVATAHYRHAPYPPRARSAPLGPHAWPDARSGTADVPVLRAAGSHQVTVPGTPVSAEPASSTRPGPARVTVTVASQAVARRLGITGVVFRVAAARGSGRVVIGVDYAAFADAYGGNFGSRLRLVELPACALAAPQPAGCASQRAVPGAVNVAGLDELSGTVSLPAGGTGVVLAATSTTYTTNNGNDGGDGGGTFGSYTATSLKPSGSWSTGGSTGDFTYSYPITVPPAPSGMVPAVSLNYDSGQLDGQTSATQTQADWLGDGWSTPENYIEQTYVPCTDDPEGSAPDNTTTPTSDNCYDGQVLTLSLNGLSTSVVYDSSTPTGYTLAADNGDMVQKVTGSGNGTGTYDSSYWVITDRSGTKYYFGLNHLPGWQSGDPATDSVNSEPVFAGQPGDPCYNSTWADSVCTMAYRWNLDYVTDVHGNAMAWYYHQDTNAYLKNAAATYTTKPDADASYIRDSYLTRIDYGFTNGNAYTVNGGHAPDQVTFSTADRCNPATDCDGLSADPADYPDVPWDLHCDLGSGCLVSGPTFWSTAELSGITTQQWTGSAYTPVDEWTFTQVMPKTSDGSAPTLFLSAINHTGDDTTAGGAKASVPPVLFTPINEDNRVDPTDSLPSLSRARISTITTESGSVITVSYELASACTSTDQSDPSANTGSCFPVWWTPPGLSATRDWFNKYQVASVTQTDPSGGAPDLYTGYRYLGGAAWHYDDSDGVKHAYRTYSQYRGFGDVQTFTGQGSDPQTETETTFYRGMSGDADNATTTGAAVTLTDSQGGQHDDTNQLAGEPLEVTSYDYKGGPAVRSVIYSYWVSAAAATRDRTAQNLPPLTANATGLVETWTRQALHSGSTTTWRKTETDTSYYSSTSSDYFGLPEYTYTHGDLSLTGNNQVRCTITSYAPASINTGPSADTSTNLTGFVSRTETDADPCGGSSPDGASAPTASQVNALTAPASVSRPADVVSDTCTVYDDASLAQTWPQATTSGCPASTLTKGEVSEVLDATGYASGAFTYQPKQAAVYDSTGRVTGSWDGNGNKTTTSYTASSYGLTTKVTTTNPLGQDSSITLDPERGLTTSSTDPNGIVTTTQYDGLGRVTAIWDNSTYDPANQWPAYETFTYTTPTPPAPGSTSPTLPWAVTTNVLNDLGGYATSTTILDALLRVRQTQGPTPQGGRLVTDTFYDSRGWAWKTNTRWWDQSAPPGTTIATIPDSQVPDQTVTAFDGLGRPVLATSYDDSTVKSQTATAYDQAAAGDGDATITVPLDAGGQPYNGGTPTATVTDALGRTSQLSQYTTLPAVSITSSATPVITTVAISGGATQATDYTWDNAMQQSQVTDEATSQTWTSDYNLLGQKVSQTDPDAGTTTMTYDGDGNLTQSTDADGTTLSWTYDALNRKTAEYDAPLTSQSGASEIASWVYDNSDNAVPGMTDPIGHLTSSTRYIGGTSGAAYTEQAKGFNDFGEPTGQTITLPASEGTLGTSYTFTYTYNQVSGYPDKTYYPASPGAGALPAETVVEGYATANGIDLPTAVGGLNSYGFNVDYTAFGQVGQEEIGSSVANAYITNTWDPHTGLLTDTNIKNVSATPLDDTSYGYDPAGNPVRQTETRQGTVSETQCFSYDTLDRLTQAWTATDNCAADPGSDSGATVGDGLAGAAYWTSWAYNPAGLRTTETDHGLGGAAGTTTGYGYNGNGTGQPDTLTSTTTSGAAAGSSAYTYDADGNVTSRTITAGGATTRQSLAWYDTGALKQVSSSPGGTSSYIYDADGNLLLQKNPGITTLYLPGEELILHTATGAVDGYRYYPLPGGGTAVRTGTTSTDGTTSTSYFFELTDQHGTATLTLDSALTTSSATWRLFTPYGAPRGPAVAWVDNRGFLGKPDDTATGLTSIGARWYDPATATFQSPDPVFETTSPQQHNGYTYAADNPETNTDPTGQYISECGNSCGITGGGNPPPPPGGSGPPPPPPGGGSQPGTWDPTHNDLAGMRAWGYTGPARPTLANIILWQTRAAANPMLHNGAWQFFCEGILSPGDPGACAPRSASLGQVLGGFGDLFGNMLSAAAIVGGGGPEDPAGDALAAGIEKITSELTGTTTTEEAGAGLPTLEIDAQRMPNIARNIQSALDEGHPGILNRTTNQDLINANRTAACSGFCGSGSPDEYPFASTYQGGAGARIADVPIQEQRIQGGVMSSFYAKYGISDGDPFQVIVTGLWEAP